MKLSTLSTFKGSSLSIFKELFQLTSKRRLQASMMNTINSPRSLLSKSDLARSGAKSARY
jgi:hypothetical protein